MLGHRPEHRAVWGAAAACVLGVACVTLVGAPGASAGAGAARWSAPAPLTACPVRGAPQIVFPSDSPTHATGPGALVWEDGPRCPGGERAWLAPLAGDDRPTGLAGTSAARALPLRGEVRAGAAPGGRVLVAGTATTGPSRLALVQGVAGGALAPLPSAGFEPGPLALDSSYLDDVALAGVASAGVGPLVRIERHYADSFGPPSANAGVGGVDALTVALDFRSDALLVWQRRGGLYARSIPAAGPAGVLQRLGSAPSAVRVAAVLSDDDRAIVAWSEQTSGVVSVYVDRSGAGVRFAAPQRLERFPAPDRATPPAASPSLVRLRSESVMLAWDGAVEGLWAVRAASVDLNGVGPPQTVSEPGGDALLAGLAPAPDGSALALWSERTPAGGAEVSILAALGGDIRPDRTAFAAPELVAPPGANSDPSASVDPGSGRAVAAWRGPGGKLLYAVRGTAAEG